MFVANPFPLNGFIYLKFKKMVACDPEHNKGWQWPKNSLNKTIKVLLYLNA